MIDVLKNLLTGALLTSLAFFYPTATTALIVLNDDKLVIVLGGLLAVPAYLALAVYLYAVGKTFNN